MKTSKEMADSVLKTRDEYIEKRKQRNIRIRRTLSLAACFTVIFYGYRIWSNIPKLPKVSPVIDDSTTHTETNNEGNINNTSSETTENQAQTTTIAQTNNISATETVTSGIYTNSSIQEIQFSNLENQTTSIVTVSQQVAINHSTTQTKPIQTTPTNPETQKIPANTTFPVVQTQPIQTTTPSQITDKPPVTTTNESPSNIVTEPVTNTEPVQPVGPPAQPITFSDINVAIDAVSVGDVSFSPAQYQKSYIYMYDRIKSDGFLFSLNNTDTVTFVEDWGITLFPYAKYEDVGIGCFAKFNEENYHIMFYYADHNIIAQTNGIAEYLKSRMGSRSDKEITVAEKNVSLSFSDDGQIYADTFIDPYHYISVKSVVSEEEMIDFIESLSYEIIPLF